MVHTFATREDATIFASAMRADGYHAEVMDDCMGSIYGPLAIGGIRVIVSDAPITGGDDDGDGEFTLPPPPQKAADGEFRATVRLLVVGVAGLGLIMVALSLLWVVLRLIHWFTESPIDAALAVFHLLKVPLGIVLSFVLLGPCMPAFTRWMRGERVSEGDGILRWLLLAALVPLLLLVIALW